MFLPLKAEKMILPLLMNYQPCLVQQIVPWNFWVYHNFHSKLEDSENDKSSKTKLIQGVHQLIHLANDDDNHKFEKSPTLVELKIK